MSELSCVYSTNTALISFMVNTTADKVRECVCVCERERERERGGDTERERQTYR